jgi:hypothetical protein
MSRAARTLAACSLGIGALALVATSVDADRGGAQQQQAAEHKAPQHVDPKADRLLRAMSSELAKTKDFQFDARHVYEGVTADGQKLQTLAQAHVQVQRPNKLRSDRLGPVANLTLYYDGNNLTLYGKRANLYATTNAPRQLDDAIDFARERLDLEAPGADLLYSNVYDGLMSDVQSGKYIALEPVGDRMCHHLAYRANETDWQIWIEDGPHPLPCRYVITSKRVKGSPEYMVELTNWQESAIPEDHFVFTPPRGAQRIEFLALRGIKGEMKKEQARREQRAKRRTP